MRPAPPTPRPRYLSTTPPHQVRHVEAYPHTLLPRFMGAHRLIVPELGKVRLVPTTSRALLTTGDLNDGLLLS